jgi:formylglycine-generating enzyme required for sulfatase activity
VTFEQFAHFVREERYFQKEYWHQDARRNFWDLYLGREGFGGDEVLRRIGFRWPTRNMPVTGVSWFEADAYCKFAGGRLPWFYELVDQTNATSSSVPEWCGDWFHSKAHGPDVNPESPLRRRIVNWHESQNAVPELTSGPIGFRVLKG